MGVFKLTFPDKPFRILEMQNTKNERVYLLNADNEKKPKPVRESSEQYLATRANFMADKR